MAVLTPGVTDKTVIWVIVPEDLIESCSYPDLNCCILLVVVLDRLIVVPHFFLLKLGKFIHDTLSHSKVTVICDRLLCRQDANIPVHGDK